MPLLEVHSPERTNHFAIQSGLLYRLRLPRKGHSAAAPYLAKDGSEVIVFVWGHAQRFGKKQLSFALYDVQEDHTMKMQKAV